MESITMQPIGIVQADVDEKVYENWGDVESTIMFEQEYASGLLGLEAYSHVIVIFYMDQFQEPQTTWARKPRGIETLEPKGCFANRTKHRPNPIGITTVELVTVSGNSIIVRGLDANDQTPVLDIKPYIPDFDNCENAQIPEWMAALMINYF